MSIPLFDAHCDTIFESSRSGGGLRENGLHLDLARLSRYSPRAQVFAIWSRGIPPVCDGPDRDDSKLPAPYAAYRRRYAFLLARLKAELCRNEDIVRLCLTAEDIHRSRESGKLAAFIGVEGAEHLLCSPICLKKAYEDGVRLVTLTWNYDNALAGSSRGAAGYGLTAKGREFVRRAQDLGVIVDLSHISEAAFWDALETADKPLIASHSNSRSVCNHPRNLTDAQFKALVKAGGAAGINLCPDFLGGGRDINAVIAHIEHFLSLGGEGAVALGADLDGIDDLPSGFRGVEDMAIIYEALLKLGYSESLVRDIFYNNWMRVFGEVL